MVNALCGWSMNSPVIKRKDGPHHCGPSAHDEFNLRLSCAGSRAQDLLLVLMPHAPAQLLVLVVANLLALGLPSVHSPVIPDQ